jgi:hypothetical protein
MSRDAEPVWGESEEDARQPASTRQAIKIADPDFIELDFMLLEGANE